MKIGGGYDPSKEVPLPTEVIEAIVAQIATTVRTGRVRQVNLWSLCLVSRAWYTVAVPHLYRSPVLGVYNFEAFVRTVCPPVSSRARATGLEDLVTRLDLGNLAYVTTKSTTAKLLRRARKSLESFTAPSHSMSVSCLAPISKLQKLEHLDLSRDRYDFDILDLLKAIGLSQTLRHVSLPPRALADYRADDPSQSKPSPWPPNLRSLVVNDSTPDSFWSWRNFIGDLPEGLEDIAFRHMRSHQGHNFLALGDFPETADGVISLSIEDEPGHNITEDSLMSISSLLYHFPHTQSLTVPESGINTSTLTFDRADKAKRVVSTLAFSKSEDLEDHAPPYVAYLTELVATVLTQLTRMEFLREVAAYDLEDCSELHHILTERLPDISTLEKGIFFAGKRWMPDPG